MRQGSILLSHFREITYEFDERIYRIKPSPEGVSIIIQDLPLQTRFISNVPKTIFSQESLQRPVQIFDCLVNQYISNYKLPKQMLVIENSPNLTMLIKLSYPGAPVRELRYDCSSQEILNPKLQSYQVTLSKMADKVMKEAIERYLPAIKQTFQQYSEFIKKNTQIMIEKIEKKGAEIIHLSTEKFEKIMEQTQMEMSKGIKDYKEYLGGQTEGLRRQIDLRASIMMKEVRRKVKGLEECLPRLRQNQHQICKILYDIEFSLTEEINSIKGKLYGQAAKKVHPYQLKSHALQIMENEYLKDSAEFEDNSSNGVQRTKSAPKKYKQQKTGLYSRYG